MTLATQSIIRSAAGIAPQFKLEFRTWNGAAYVWTDYTSRLVDWSGIGASVENMAFPNAFKMKLGTIRMTNDNGWMNNIDTIDGLLVNATEPYGTSIYKRLVRITADVGTGVYVPVATGLVRDVKIDNTHNWAIIDTISLDARASDQQADGATAERHPLGSTSKSTPSTWTLTQPASATDNVNMYRVRESETDGQLYFEWFTNRRFTDVAERTAWALDDLATDIDKTTLIYTTDGREIVTKRNTPPDDTAVSTGVSPERTGAIVWNPDRGVLVVCVGHKVYDYDLAANTYTLRNTLTAGRDVVRAFYLDKADSGGESKRIVLVQCDVDTYNTTGLRVTTAWVTVLDAEGAGAYTLLANESSLGTDVFPGTHMVRDGENANSIQSVGNILTNTSGENAFALYESWIDVLNAGAGTEYLEHQDDNATKDLLFDAGSTTVTPPQTKGRGYFSSYKNITPFSNLGLRWPWGTWFAAAVNWYATGGELYYFTWDSGNNYRLKSYNLNTYAAGSYTNLNTANTHVPYCITCHKDAAVDQYVYVAQIEWDESGGVGSYSTGRLMRRDLSASTWSEYTWMSGAGTTDAAWHIMDMAVRAAGPTLCATIFNRYTGKWRFVKNIAVNTWADTNTNSATGFANGVANQDNPLMGLVENANYSTDRVFFVEYDAQFLWSWDGTTFRSENKTPAGAGFGNPICTDYGMTCPPCVSAANTPTASTPNGILFGVSANDWRTGASHPSGEYVLWQFANFDAGFVDLLDVSGLSFWALRTTLAEAFGYVHYYKGDGTFVFRPRTTTGASVVTYTGSDNNLLSAAVQTRGFEAIINDVTVTPYGIEVNDRVGAIIKGNVSGTLSGELADVHIFGDPGESSLWRCVFVSPTTFDLYKLTGTNFSTSTPKLAAASIDSNHRDITDGAYIQIYASDWRGVFVIGDNFTFDVFRPIYALAELTFFDRVLATNSASITAYRRQAAEYSNRFIDRNRAVDYAANLLAWPATRHDIVEITTPFNPSINPLDRVTLTESAIGFSGTTFQVMGISHGMHQPTKMTLAKV